MKKAILTAMFIYTAAGLHAQGLQRFFYSNTQQLRYEICYSKGLLNGKYIAYYSNGRKKVEGFFKDNQRKGIWSAWDSTGELLASRRYANLYSFEAVFSKESNEALASTDRQTYAPLKNEGVLQYPRVREKDVVAIQRYWRTLQPGNANGPVFRKDRLFNLLKKALCEGSVKAYDSDEFINELPAIDIAAVFNHLNTRRLTYKLKEDWIYNKSIDQAESRIIGIAMVIDDPICKDQKTLCWIYLPQIRSLLAKENLTVKGHKEIKTLDDYFFYRHFNAAICEEVNYAKEARIVVSAKEAAEKEATLIDKENTIWLKEIKGN